MCLCLFLHPILIFAWQWVRACKYWKLIFFRNPLGVATLIHNDVKCYKHITHSWLLSSIWSAAIAAILYIYIYNTGHTKKGYTDNSDNKPFIIIIIISHPTIMTTYSDIIHGDNNEDETSTKSMISINYTKIIFCLRYSYMKYAVHMCVYICRTMRLVK